MSDDLDHVRAEIDGLDDEIIALLGRRLALARRAAATKWASGLPVVQAERMRAILADRCARAEAADVPAAVAGALWRAIFEQAHRWDMDQRRARGRGETDSAPGPAPGVLGDAALALDHVALPVADIAQARAWLQARLGAREDADDPGDRAASDRDPGADVWLGPLRVRLRPATDPGGAALVFAAHGAGVLAQDLRERGAPAAVVEDGQGVSVRVAASPILGLNLRFEERWWGPPEPDQRTD